MPQVFIAKYLGADLPALVASICSMACTILMAKAMHGFHTYFFVD